MRLLRRIIGFALKRGAARTDERAHAVGADQAIGLETDTHRAAQAGGAHARWRLLESGERGLRMKTDAGFGKRRLAQNSDEIGAMHVEIRRAPALFGIGKRQTCERRAVAGAANVNGVRREAGLGSSGRTPRSRRMPLAFGESCRPAPIFSVPSRRSMSVIRQPRRARAIAAVRPPTPAPAIKTCGDPAFSGNEIRRPPRVGKRAFRRFARAGRQARVMDIMGRAIGADRVVRIAHVDENMRMIEWAAGRPVHMNFLAPIRTRATPG